MSLLTSITPRSIIKHYGTGYYRATFLFPKKIREAVWTLYQFVRLPDEIVDTETGDKDAKLRAWEDTWNSVLAGSATGHQVMHNFKHVVDTYHIPHLYTHDFLRAMRQDLTKDRYATYTELEEYMHGSATVVGYMMSYIIGFQEGALPCARALGEAFQMTNFLRDIKADYDERGRIYIPQEDMEQFGVTEAHVRDGVVDDAWRALMQYEIARTRALYEKGVAGIAHLHPHGRKAVYAAALIYKEILDTIEKNGYNVFSRRAVVSPFQKTVLLWKALWKRNQ
jgi:phytoene synthase